jgi:uncharacterized protein YjbI with pentapeptide repeats
MKHAERKEKAMFPLTIEKFNQIPAESYQLITDEKLAGIVVAHQILAGSRVQMSTYHDVTFSQCVFYGVEFKDVEFDNCHFENCTIEFSHIKNCKFKNCTFTDCKWLAASSRHSVFEDCELDPHLSALTEHESNDVTLSLPDDQQDLLDMAIAC